MCTHEILKNLGKMLAICFMSFVVIVLTLESVFIFELPDIFRDIKKKKKEVDSDFVPAFSEDKSVQGMPVITNIQTWCSSQSTNDN